MHTHMHTHTELNVTDKYWLYPMQKAVSWGHGWDISFPGTFFTQKGASLSGLRRHIQQGGCINTSAKEEVEESGKTTRVH